MPNVHNNHVKLHQFPDAQSLSAAVAAHVSAQLVHALADGSTAWLVASGGSTPKLYLPPIAQAPLDWFRVHVTLADERLPPDNLPQAQTQALKNETLLQNSFLEKIDSTSGKAQWHELNENSAQLWPTHFDVVLLGMGNDGHFASIFPHEPELQRLLGLSRTEVPLDSAQSVARVSAPRHIEPKVPRITMTLARLLATRLLILVIQGQEKLDLLHSCMNSTNDVSHLEPPERASLPVASLIMGCANQGVVLHVFACP